MGTAQRRARLLAALVVGSVVFAACGSDSNSSSATEGTTASGGGETTAASAAGSDTSAAAGSDTSAAAGGSGVEAAKAAIAKFTTESDEIGVTKPLTGKPDKKTFAWLECELESCPYITVGIKEAVAALGWDLKVI